MIKDLKNKDIELVVGALFFCMCEDYMPGIVRVDRVAACNEYCCNGSYYAEFTIARHLNSIRNNGVVYSCFIKTS